jgi:hypothetical protein
LGLGKNGLGRLPVPTGCIARFGRIFVPAGIQVTELHGGRRIAAVGRILQELFRARRITDQHLILQVEHGEHGFYFPIAARGGLAKQVGRHLEIADDAFTRRIQLSRAHLGRADSTLGRKFVPVRSLGDILLDTGAFGIEDRNVVGGGRMPPFGGPQEPPCRVSKIERHSAAGRMQAPENELRLQVPVLGGQQVLVRSLAKIGLDAFPARIEFRQFEDGRQVFLFRSLS